MDCAIFGTGGRIVTAVEWDNQIAEQYRFNFPEVRLLVQSVQSINPEDLELTDHIHLSPPCTEASIANPKAVESDASISAAIASLGLIRSMHRRGGAKWITLENVWGYRKFQSFQIIVNGLRKLGYALGYQKLNAADFGTPQNRERLWLRAVRSDSIQTSRQLSLFGNDELLPLSGTEKRVSWWEAIAHIELPITTLNAGQIKRLPKSLINQLNRGKSLLIGKQKNQAAIESAQCFTITSTIHKQLPLLIKRVGANDRDRPIPHTEPSSTIRSLNGRTDGFDLINQDTVRRLTPEALWILQMYGCERLYSWKPMTPNSLKCKVIGNGVAYLNAQAVLESLTFNREKFPTLVLG